MVEVVPERGWQYQMHSGRVLEVMEMENFELNNKLENLRWRIDLLNEAHPDVVLRALQSASADVDYYPEEGDFNSVGFTILGVMAKNQRECLCPFQINNKNIRNTTSQYAKTNTKQQQKIQRNNTRTATKHKRKKINKEQVQPVTTIGRASLFPSRHTGSKPFRDAHQPGGLD